MGPVRADVVGSLLRTPELLSAREDLAAGRITPASFKAIEDAAVDDAVRLQEEAGLRVVTDGEMRRLSFQSVLSESVEGFAEHDLDAFLWGSWKGDEMVGDRSLERPPLAIVSRLRRRRSLAAEELTYLRARTTRTPKITLPSPTLWANFWDPKRSSSVYATLDAYLADVVDILVEEVAELGRLGATYLQIDAPHYTAFLDPGGSAFYESLGWNGERWLSRAVEMDNAVMAAKGITFGFHLCRGNQESRWLVRGGYVPLLPILRKVSAERLLLEYDDERSGGFEPLAEIPEGKVVVLGLVTTKSPRLETVEDLERRIREAGRFLPLDRLAISPQCGFASSILGNRISEEDERNKLGTLVEAARRVWGSP